MRRLLVLADAGVKIFLRVIWPVSGHNFGGFFFFGGCHFVLDKDSSKMVLNFFYLMDMGEIILISDLDKNG